MYVSARNTLVLWRCSTAPVSCLLPDCGRKFVYGRETIGVPASIRRAQIPSSSRFILPCGGLCSPRGGASCLLILTRQSFFRCASGCNCVASLRCRLVRFMYTPSCVRLPAVQATRREGRLCPRQASSLPGCAVRSALRRHSGVRRGPLRPAGETQQQHLSGDRYPDCDARALVRAVSTVQLLLRSTFICLSWKPPT